LLKLFIKRKENIDLIVLDVKTSIINSFKLCKNVKHNPSYHKIPIIFITSSTYVKDEIYVLSC